MVRCWVDDSTAAGHGETQGLAVWAEATRGFEDLEQGDGAKVNRKKSGVLCSHPRLQRLVELATALRGQCPFGLVVGYGPVEPAGWEELWGRCWGPRWPRLSAGGARVLRPSCRRAELPKEQLQQLQRQ